LNDPETAAHLREIIANLNSSSVKLDENLEALQHNFLFRGFFRRRARQEEKERKEAQKQAEESARRERMLLEEKN
jgi:phospholipid/cholesterol/gamma-HCH transport system substrate-binding protein